MRVALVLGLLGTFLGVVACGSNVTVGLGPEAEGEGAGRGTRIDPDCFEACIEEGGGTDACARECTEDEDEDEDEGEGTSSGDDIDCIEACKDSIPSGVPPVTDLMECMVCGAASPCASACAQSALYGYCE